MDLRGSIIEQLLLTGDVVLMNTGEPTHYHVQNNSYSAIDLSLCSPDLVHEHTWEVMDDLHGGDHFPMLIKRTEQENTIRQPQYILRLANWNLFRYGTTIQENNIFNCDERLERFITVVKMAADNSIPKSSGNVGRVLVPWWTDECARVNSDRKHALRQYQRSGLLVHKISYIRWRSKARYVKNGARRSSFKNYVSGLNINTPMSKVWSRIRKMSGK